MTPSVTDSAGPVTPGIAGWLERIQRANGNEGNYLAAYDLCMKALAAWPDAMVFEHQAILALARAGALNRALQRYRRLDEAGRLTALTDLDLAAEFAGLFGRLLKDCASGSSIEDAKKHRLGSAIAYANAFERLGKYYLAINAASMYLSCGKSGNARHYARLALELAAAQREQDYWSHVTQAEACLILGQFDTAIAMLKAAADDRRSTIAVTGAENLDAVASTRRQLTWVAGLTHAPAGIVDVLPKPRVLNWISRPELLLTRDPFAFAPGQTVIAFGPLMSTADLLIANALLEVGANVHVVLPCEPDSLAARTFLEQPKSVDMLARVLGHERVRVTLVTKEGSPDEPAGALLCQQQARGLALLRGHSLLVDPELCFPGDGTIGFGAIPSDNRDITGVAPPGGARSNGVRKPHAIVFGDVRGFSALNEAEQLTFLEHVIGGFANALQACGGVEYAETAGDGLFIVLSDVMAAIDCCFRLQKVLRPEKTARLGLPAHLGIRLSAHVGPLYRRYDKVIHRHKFVGMEVVRTARIEPVTPVGEIFVTEQFAAALAFTTRDAYVCEYAGMQPMAKNFGECRMYSLRRAGRRFPA
ncbi:adenylate and Guanylate cyclase catalytic domain protein [Paraburkholderia xenovorans LB400]|uniref:Adenylate/Guanylate Cyclase n=1 Tax=Paraburkholderia xenovorans (strain LB400) TaxID=266265 RepID=Q13FL6_PARXL|nr:tetratricopeptide repeat-containing protein [Paraburkholderia xenovorans]ABE37123.1 Putative Adenylate/Guanylate Cyclase [Paraburkholderia xenovorans LB400]AIP33896.1 adenylate and Guanylate cyclase catalytic domain protein [Paraburkholderia xenovorans LB400]